MRGTIISHTTKSGKKSWGYSYFVGRDETGKRIQKVKRGFAKKGDAEEALRKALQDQGKAPATIEDSIKTLNEAFEEWMLKHVRRECTPRTAEAYQEQAGYVLRRIGDRSLQAITRNLVEDTMLDIADHGGVKTQKHPQGRPLSRKMTRNIGFVLRGCLAYAVYRDYIPKHPMDGMKLPKLEKNRRPKVVEADEFEKVLRLAAGTRLFPLIVLAEATGLRRGELCGLLWSDINMTTGVMSVNKSVEETKAGGLRIKGTKSDKPRDVVIPAYALEVLERWRVEQARDRELYGAGYAGHGLVFCRPDGEYYRPKQVTARARGDGKGGTAAEPARPSSQPCQRHVEQRGSSCDRGRAPRPFERRRDVGHLHASAQGGSGHCSGGLGPGAERDVIRCYQGNAEETASS